MYLLFRYVYSSSWRGLHVDGQYFDGDVGKCPANVYNDGVVVVIGYQCKYKTLWYV